MEIILSSRATPSQGVLPIIHYKLDLLFQAELQKMRVEMAAMKRDAEHYSRQVIILLFLCEPPLLPDMFKIEVISWI